MSRPRGRRAEIRPDSPAVAIITAVAVLIVGGATFYISFQGLLQVAGWMLLPASFRWTLPVALDGVVIVYSFAALIRRAKNLSTTFAFSMAGALTVISAAANVAHVLLPEGTANVATQRAIGAALAGLASCLVFAAVHQLSDLVVATPDQPTPRKPAAVAVDVSVVPAALPAPDRPAIAPRRQPTTPRVAATRGGVSPEIRDQILALAAAGHSQRSIAEAVRSSKSAVGRVLTAASQTAEVVPV